METTLNINELRTWIGRTETVVDVVGPGPARRLQATLDRDPTFAVGDALPPFWHYLYFNPEATASQLKEDGHEQLGRFLPPVTLPRRMWANGLDDSCFTDVFSFQIRQQDVDTSIGAGLRTLIWNQMKADVLTGGNDGTFD